MIDIKSLEPVTVVNACTSEPVINVGAFEPMVGRIEAREEGVVVRAQVGSVDMGSEFIVLANKSKYALYELVNHEVVTNAFVKEEKGKVSYLASKFVGENKQIVFYQDHVSYKNTKIDDEIKKMGIMLRIEAEVSTIKGEVSLNGLFAIGAAVSAGAISGKLKIKVFGLSGESILNAIPAPSNLSEESLLNALTCIATIKSKIYDDSVYVVPQELPVNIFDVE
jgi:hypothetical protein